MKISKMVVLAAIIGMVGAGSIAKATTLEELIHRVEKLEKENRKLNEQLQQTDERVNLAADTFEAARKQSGQTKGQAMQQTRMGGYGELHYNNLSGDGGAEDKDEMDFHRFVLFVDHEFSDSIKFFSELELEHSIAGDDKVGEVELEQAFIDFKVNDSFNIRGGLFLLPVGIINETHEPPTFYGVERNPVEKNIIPATWWEGGVGVYGEIIPGLSYDLYLHSGLETSSDDNYKVRDGRQKVGKASTKNLASTARIRWNGTKGVEVAASFHIQDDITQETDPTAGEASMLTAHAIWSKGPFTLKALYAIWDLDGSGPEALGADEQEGYYLEPSFKITSQLGVFARFNNWDNQAGSSSKSEKQQWDFGINYWPHPDVVVKVDYQNQDNEDHKDQDGINIGIGYQF